MKQTVERSGFGKPLSPFSKTPLPRPRLPSAPRHYRETARPAGSGVTPGHSVHLQQPGLEFGDDDFLPFGRQLVERRPDLAVRQHILAFVGNGPEWSTTQVRQVTTGKSTQRLGSKSFRGIGLPGDLGCGHVVG